MLSRSYELYAKESGAYEIVLRGYSFYALFLQGFWAIANGQFFQYFVLGLPTIMLGFLAEVWSVGAIILIGYLVFAFGFYYPVKSSRWRAKELLKSRYDLIYSTEATSAKDVLQKYAKLSTAA